MDEQFPPPSELTRRELLQLALREVLQGPFVPVTPTEWRDLQVPQPEITQL